MNVVENTGAADSHTLVKRVSCTLFSKMESAKELLVAAVGYSLQVQEGRPAEELLQRTSHQP